MQQANSVLFPFLNSCAEMNSHIYIAVMSIYDTVHSFLHPGEEE